MLKKIDEHKQILQLKVKKILNFFHEYIIKT